MPLLEVDNELTRLMSRWTSVSSRVLLNSMHDVAKKMGMTLEVTLGICFGIMFDGWSSGSMHYVAVYGGFETDGNLRLQLLAVSPLDDEVTNNFFRALCLPVLPSELTVREGPGEVVVTLADGNSRHIARREITLPYTFHDFRSNDDFLVVEMNYAFDGILGIL
ncbi:hypothetical protein PC110_g14304 [Phytophthora cactorum]|uniref:Uncharacterized protein n=1 Tax=Phytophthora cactorum TaxID=29920 RepID=A0A329RYA0_9STRA|nr:hypothetical protein PC110_g14304 [Phytophthora cactorum]